MILLHDLLHVIPRDMIEPQVQFMISIKKILYKKLWPSVEFLSFCIDFPSLLDLVFGEWKIFAMPPEVLQDEGPKGMLRGGKLNFIPHLWHLMALEGPFL